MIGLSKLGRVAALVVALAAPCGCTPDEAAPHPDPAPNPAAVAELRGAPPEQAAPPAEVPPTEAPAETTGEESE